MPRNLLLDRTLILWYTEGKKAVEEMRPLGKLDTETKRYVSKPSIFADVFNYLLFNGEQIIKPDALTAVDTTEIITPYGNNAKIGYRGTAIP